MLRALRSALAIALLVLFALPVAAAAPKAVVDKPIVDVGKVKKGDPVRHEFVIRNAGDAPLEITEVKPSCGCTVADYDKVIELTPRYSAAHYQRGVVRSKLGQHEQAIADYSEAIRLAPQQPEPYYGRSHSYRQLGQDDKAAADLVKATELDASRKKTPPPSPPPAAPVP